MAQLGLSTAIKKALKTIIADFEGFYILTGYLNVNFHSYLILTVSVG